MHKQHWYEQFKPQEEAVHIPKIVGARRIAPYAVNRNEFTKKADAAFEGIKHVKKFMRQVWTVRNDQIIDVVNTKDDMLVCARSKRASPTADTTTAETSTSAEPPTKKSEPDTTPKPGVVASTTVE